MRTKPARTSLSLQQLNPRLDKMIAAYATAASAMGVAVLAASPSAEAKIVYTKTRVIITPITRTYALDLNHDGIADFNLGFCSCIPHGNGVTIRSYSNVGNAAVEDPSHSYSAAALVGGAAIGPARVFRSVYRNGGAGMAFAGSYVSGPYSVGPWAGGKNAYLGLKFVINGQVHFGWARVTVTRHIGQVVLTGYAYETVANKHLKAGQTSETPQEAAEGSAVAYPSRGPSLGMLARGVETMEVWRREEEEKESAA